MAKTRIGAAAIFTFVCVVGLSLAAVLLGGPPAPVPASAAATEFSAERAMVYVRAIAERPHPMGSADHARVRDYLVKTIEGLGVAVERQDATIVRSVAAGVRIGRVENLLVRLKGTASTGAVLLATHYDSVPAAPGAADAGSGVAALIETLRALKAGYPLRNDLIVLLTDGEEFGLLGAAAFAEQHPWAKDVRLALNFEARGTSGPAQMFETGPENGAVVRAWAAAMPRPTGSSLSYEVYKRMPNDTDFSIFRKLPVVGLNFSFVGGWEDYHTPHDAPAALDRGSLQHHGSAALSLARRFGGIDLTAVRGRDAVYFSLPIVNKAVVYSTLWALPLAVLAVVLFLWAFILSRGRKETSIGGLILAVVVVALFGAAAGYFGWRFGRLVELLHQSWLPEGNVLQSAPYGALLVATIITVWCALYVVLRKKFAAHTLAYGSIVLWVAAGVAAAWFLPGGSYVVLWPVLSAVLTAVVLATSGRAESPGGFRVLLACVLAVPAALVIWPLDAALFGTMGLSPESGAGMALMTVYGLGALALSIELITEGRRWWPAGLAFAVTLVCLGLGGALTHYSDEHPRIVNVYYVLDADAKDARWTARVSRMDSWIETYVGAHPAEGRPPAFVPPWSTPSGLPGYLNGPAPIADVPAPEAAATGNAVAEGGRTLTMHVSPAQEGHVLSVWTNGASVIDAAIDGRPVKINTAPRASGDTAWSLDYINAPASGATLTLTLKGTQPLTVAVVDRFSGLPGFPGKSFGSRPTSVVQIQTGDQTVVRRTYVF